MQPNSAEPKLDLIVHIFLPSLCVVKLPCIYYFVRLATDSLPLIYHCRYDVDPNTMYKLSTLRLVSGACTCNTNTIHTCPFTLVSGLYASIHVIIRWDRSVVYPSNWERTGRIILVMIPSEVCGSAAILKCNPLLVLSFTVLIIPHCYFLLASLNQTHLVFNVMRVLRLVGHSVRRFAWRCALVI